MFTTTCSSILTLSWKILKLSGFEYPIYKRRAKVYRLHSNLYPDFNIAEIIRKVGDFFPRMNSLILGILESPPFERR